MKDSVRSRAAVAILKLAERAADSATTTAALAKGSGWTEIPDRPNFRMHAARVDEALAFYDIAFSIDYETAEHGYQKALLLERVGRVTEALAIYDSITERNLRSAVKEAVARCRARMQQGAQFPGQSVTEAQLDEIIDKLDEVAAVHVEQESKRSAPIEVTESDESGQIRKIVAEFAVDFVGLLLKRNYQRAHEMLDSSSVDLSPEGIRDEFEAMFEGERFPRRTLAPLIDLSFPNMQSQDIALAYVPIESENSEAVSLTIGRVSGAWVVTRVEFGRP